MYAFKVVAPKQLNEYLKGKGYFVDALNRVFSEGGPLLHNTRTLRGALRVLKADFKRYGWAWTWTFEVAGVSHNGAFGKTK